jgi:hypothetical protein
MVGGRAFSWFQRSVAVDEVPGGCGPRPVVDGGAGSVWTGQQLAEKLSTEAVTFPSGVIVTWAFWVTMKLSSPDVA